MRSRMTSSVQASPNVSRAKCTGQSDLRWRHLTRGHLELVFCKECHGRLQNASARRVTRPTQVTGRPSLPAPPGHLPPARAGAERLGDAIDEADPAAVAERWTLEERVIEVRGEPELH